MFALELLGTLSLHCDTHPVAVAARQKRPLGLLAVLALGSKPGVSRDRMEAYLWPESSGALARHALDQTVYAIRHALGSDVLLSTGRELRLNPALVAVDVWEFEEAISAGQWAAAVDLYNGTLLDGVHFAESNELESWIDTERARLRGEYQSALESLADTAAAEGDDSQNIGWCRRLPNSDPLSARATKRLMLALAAAGDRAGAVKHARVYQQLIRQALEIEPDCEIEGLAATYSYPGVAETAAATRLRSPIIVPALSAQTLTAEPETNGVAETKPRGLSRGSGARVKRLPIVGVVSFAALIVSLIGVGIAQNPRGRNRRSSIEENAARVSSPLPVLGARESYRRALAAWSDGSKAGLDTAVVYFRRATELDHHYAAAYAGLADAYVMLGYFGYEASDAAFPKAKDAALHSMQLDSTLAHPALAYALTWERDFVGADSEFRKAVAHDPTHATAQATALDPTYATAHQWYAILLMILSQKSETFVASQPPASHDPFSLHVPVIEVTFTKWFTTYPALGGFTSFGPGTIAGEVLSRIDDGVFTHLVARYEVTDPSGAHSFKAVIQGKANDTTGRYDMNGIVTWGWMTGAQVHVTFQRMTPCQFGKLNICFQGSIHIQRG
jgi:DNA-binding SARP family transcriptional activator